MVEITKQKVEEFADIARLEVTDEEAETLAIQLSELMSFGEKLKDVDTTDVKPTINVVDMKNVMRKDEPRRWITQEEALKNASDQKDGHFRVPSILE